MPSATTVERWSESGTVSFSSTVSAPLTSPSSCRSSSSDRATSLFSVVAIVPPVCRSRRRRRPLDPEDLLLLRLELILGKDPLRLQLSELLELGGVVELGRRGRGGRGLRRHLLLVRLLILRSVLLLLAAANPPGHSCRSPCDDSGPRRHANETGASAHEWHLSFSFLATCWRAPTRGRPGRRRAEAARSRAGRRRRHASPGRRFAP